IMWSYGLIEALRTGRLAEWRRLIKNSRDITGNSSDPFPQKKQIHVFFQLCILGSIKGMSPVKFVTHDIEWNGP
ncbi:MAG: hypothetical protein OXB84_04625, partial [Halobacteriovoraceae bacterium]|nr:hypothetical protein [Halobacteriovoraceae bacterium]